MKFYDEPEICYRCGLEGQMAHHHMIPGNPGRKLSERYGLVVPLCPKCHEFVHSGTLGGTVWLQRIIKDGQRKAMGEQGWDEDQFRSVFGKNYL